MQFFKIDGLIEDEKWVKDFEDRQAWKEKEANILIHSDNFNQRCKMKMYLFVGHASSVKITIGAICLDSLKLSERLTQFMKEIDVNVGELRVEETTGKNMCSLLQGAERKGYIESEEDILETFRINRVLGRYGRDISYGEKIIDGLKKEEVFSKVEQLFVRECFVPELERIYMGTERKSPVGHPVHYMIQADDSEMRIEMTKLLIEALYSAGRIKNKRVTYLSVDPLDGVPEKGGDDLYRCNEGGAIVVEYMAEDVIEDQFASFARDITERLCKTMKKYQNKVLTIFCFQRECYRQKEIFYENLGNTSLVELKEDLAYGKRAESYLTALAKDKQILTDSSLFELIDEEKGYLATELNEMFTEWFNRKLKTDYYPQYKEMTSVKKEVIKAAPKGTAFDELNEMIGITEAKKVIMQALDFFKAQKIFAEKGMKKERVAMHMVFTGNPGTAKTTVARLFARTMKENEILSNGHLIEVGRGDLVGKFVGWTAPTIQKKFREAKGGILFIDEAYSLVDDRDGSFGDEAINTIVQEMENHREDVVVIFAGYPDEMEQFLQKNPGLRSRIAFHVPFEDYDTEELCGIAKLIAKKKELLLSEDAVEKMSEIFEVAKKESDFGNGRYVRNVIEKAKMAQAGRLMKMDFETIKSRDVRTICAEDIEKPSGVKKKKSNPIGFGVA
ncbi:MAG: AAA family ATPase [Eubacterium sp.]|nr:AAA family ATPase [Eubacterium sp.]